MTHEQWQDLIGAQRSGSQRYFRLRTRVELPGAGSLDDTGTQHPERDPAVPGPRTYAVPLQGRQSSRSTAGGIDIGLSVYAQFHILPRMSMRADKLFHLLADETRLRSVLLLHSEGRLCVCELVHALGLSQPKISRHLAQLRDGGLVIDERRGQWVHYRLADDLSDWVRHVIVAAARGGDWKDDRERLRCMPDRPVVTVAAADGA